MRGGQWAESRLGPLPAWPRKHRQLCQHLQPLVSCGEREFKMWSRLDLDMSSPYVFNAWTCTSHGVLWAGLEECGVFHAFPNSVCVTCTYMWAHRILS